MPAEAAVRGRVLIVDDDRLVARSVADLLSGAGHDCVVVGNADAAIETLDTDAGSDPAPEGFALLLIDLNLPGRDGLWLLRHVGEHHPHLACLVMTGFGKIASAVTAIKLGANDYLTKPMTDEALRGAVDTALTKQKLLASPPPPEDVSNSSTKGPGRHAGRITVDPAGVPHGENAAIRAAVDHGGHIPALTHGWTPTPLVDALRDPERQILLAALDANGWNRQVTAEQLRINRTTLYKKIKQFGLELPE